MSFLLLLQAAEAGAGHEAGAPTTPFAINVSIFFWTWAVFLTLLFLLKKFAWPQILKATLDREQRIAHQLAEAERLNAEAKATAEENRRIVAESRGQAQTLLAEAKAAAEKERASALEKVRRDQEEMVARARRDIAEERDKALVELRREAVDLSLAAASKLIGQRLDSEADKALVQQYLASLEKAH